MTAAPDWLVSTEETRERLRGWAAARGLAYEVSGLLPPVSRHLRLGLGAGWQEARVRHGRGALRRYADLRMRPERFSENVCSGTLPGGLEGVLAHHTALVVEPDETADARVALADTVVAAWVPEGMRVTRGAIGVPRKEYVPRVTIGGPEFARHVKKVALAPDRLVWEVHGDEVTAPLEWAFVPEVERALAATPVQTRVSIGDGWLTVELPELHDQPEVLDALCHAASALAAGLRRAAAGLSAHAPGAGPLRESPDTPYQRWLREGAARIAWPAPPPDVQTAIDRYLEVAKEDPAGKRRGLLARKFGGGGARGRAGAWGREAFLREYARARGLWLEDPEELRSHIAIPLPGRPEGSMYGRLASGVEVRIVTWRDRTGPTFEGRWLNLALVPARGDAAGVPVVPYELTRAGDWLVVAEDLGTGLRTTAGLDALFAEAVRLASAAG